MIKIFKKNIWVVLLILSLISSLCACEEQPEELPSALPESIQYGFTLYFRRSNESVNEATDLVEVGRLKKWQTDDVNLVGCPFYVSDSFPDVIFVLYEGELISYKK